jgi:autotransporter-associated beta strand protein
LTQNQRECFFLETVFSEVAAKMMSWFRLRKSKKSFLAGFKGVYLERLEDRLTPNVAVPGAIGSPIGSGGVHPDNGTGPSGTFVPSDIQTAYSIKSLLNNGANGSGETIAIIDAYDDPDLVSSSAANFNTSDLHTFDTGFTLGGITYNFNLPEPAGFFTKVNESGGTSYPSANASWSLEESLDVEWSHSIAPNAKLILVECTSNSFSDLFAGATWAATPVAQGGGGANIVSMSFGANGGFSGENALDQNFSPLSFPGVTFVASTGDSGSVDPNTGTNDNHGQAGYPADSPNVVAVGGTSLTVNNNETYASESVWNDGKGGNGLYEATGGGVSNFETQPAYQAAAAKSFSTTNRAAPDVAFLADPNTGVLVLDNYAGGFFDVGGTSLATPCWAGLISIADQIRAASGDSPLAGATQTLPILYNIYGSASAYSNDFHDITQGNNGTFNAGTGYDIVTGIGTPIASNAVPDLADVNQLLYMAPAGTNSFTLTENNGILDLLDNGTLVAYQPASQTTPIVIDGGTDNSLTLDFSGGVFTNNVTFDGGTGSASHTLAVQNGSFTTETYGYTGAASGSLGLGSQTITFSDTTAVNNTTTATNDVFNLPGQAANAALLEQSGVSTQPLELTSTGNTLAPTQFTAPSSSLTVNGNNAVASTITVSGLTSYSNALTITGGSAGDTVVLNSAESLSNLSVAAALIDLGSSALSATGTMTFNGSVVTGNAAAGVSSSGGNISFNGTVNGTEPLTVTDSSSSGQVTFNNTLGGTTGFTLLIADAGPASVTGVIQGSGTTLSKSGTGTLTLTNANTYGGATTVNAGTLQIDGSITSNVTVNGGTLDGVGTAGTVSVNNGAALVAGDSGAPGIFTNQALNVAAGSSFSVAIGGNSAGTGAGHYSQDHVTSGTVTVGGTLNLAAFGGFTPSAGDSYVIVNNGGGSAVSGDFLAGSGINLPAGTALTEGTVLSTNFLGSGLTATITYASNGNSVAINVSGSAPNKFSVAGFPTPSAAGAAESFTVTALSSSGTVLTGYTGTVHFTSSDPGAVLPANYTFTAGDAGVHTFTATLKTDGTQTITATDTVAGIMTGSETIVATAHLNVAITSPQTAGVAFSVTVKAENGYNSVLTGYTGTIQFTSSDPQAVLPSNYTFTAADKGVHVFTNAATFKTSGKQTLTATDAASSTIAGTSAQIQVNAAAAVSLTVSAPATKVAGSPFIFTVSARDSFGNVATSYRGTVAITSSDPQAFLPSNYTFTSGTASFAAVLITEGNQSLTATDIANTVTPGSATVNVMPAVFSQLGIGAPATTAANAGFSITVSAEDRFGNLVTSYSGTVVFTSSDHSATLPAAYTFGAGDAGTHTFSGVILDTAGSQTVSVNDKVKTGIKTSATVIVSPLAATHFKVVLTGPFTAGVPFTVQVTALDSFNNVAVGYTGTVHFTSSDNQATLPGNYVFTTDDNGVQTLAQSTIFRTSGSQTLTATDTVASSITGSATTTVSAAAATQMVLAPPATSVAGVAFSAKVTLFDAFGNVATSYTGTVHFTSNDPNAKLPAEYTFAASDKGSRSFSVTLKLAGNPTITAKDTVTSSLTSTASVSVSPAATSVLVVTVPSTSTAGSAFNVTVTAEDAFGNVTPAYSGTVHFTSSDTKAVLPADYTFVPGDNGTHLFTSGVTLKTAGSKTVTATDTVTSSIKGTGTVTVQAAALSQLAMTALTNTVAGTAFTVTVTAEDTYGNAITSYSGTVHFTSSDSQAVLPGDYTFVPSDNGKHVFTNLTTLKTAAVETVTVTDTAVSTLTATSSVSVKAASATQIGITAPANATVGVAFNIVVSALDPYGNIDYTYAGTVGFTSSDGKAKLPSNYTFTAGKEKVGFSITLGTAGSQTITITDTVKSSITGTATVVVSAGPGPAFSDGPLLALLNQPRKRDLIDAVFANGPLP